MANKQRYKITLADGRSVATLGLETALAAAKELANPGMFWNAGRKLVALRNALSAGNGVALYKASFADAPFTVEVWPESEEERTAREAAQSGHVEPDGRETVYTGTVEVWDSRKYPEKVFDAPVEQRGLLAFIGAGIADIESFHSQHGRVAWPLPHCFNREIVQMRLGTIRNAMRRDAIVLAVKSDDELRSDFADDPRALSTFVHFPSKAGVYDGPFDAQFSAIITIKLREPPVKVFVPGPRRPRAEGETDAQE